MATWPARTWSPGELVTAGMLNSVRDDLNDLDARMHGSDTRTSIAMVDVPDNASPFYLYPSTPAQTTIFSCRNAGAPITINGVDGRGAPLNDGSRLIFLNRNSQVVFLANQVSAGGSNFADFFNMPTSGPLALAANYGMVSYIRSDSLWVLEHLHQGHELGYTPTFATAGSGGPVFTMSAASATYILIENIVSIQFSFSGSFSGGAPATTLLISMPNGYKCTTYIQDFQSVRYTDGSPYKWGMMAPNPGQSSMMMWSTLDGGSFAPGTTISVQGRVSLAVM